MTNDAKRRAMTILARYAMNTLSCYRLDYFGEKPRSHRAIAAEGKIQGIQGAARVVARAFEISHAEIERELGWALSLLPLGGARRLSKTDPGDRFARLKAASLGLGEKGS